MIRSLFVFFVLLFLGVSVVGACPPYYSYYSAPVYRERVVVKEIAVATFVPVPVFSVGYAPPALTSLSPSLAQPAALPGVQTAAPAPAVAPPAAALPPSGADRLQQLQAENAELRKQLAGITGGSAGKVNYVPPPGDKTLTTAGLALVGRHCAQCHEATIAKEKGKGVVLVQGNRLAPLSEVLALKAYKAVASGAMPKGHTLSDLEIVSVLEVFTTSPQGDNP